MTIQWPLENGDDHDQRVVPSRRENRVILTRGRQLHRRMAGPVSTGLRYRVDAEKAADQLEEVVIREANAPPPLPDDLVQVIDANEDVDLSDRAVICHVQFLWEELARIRGVEEDEALKKEITEETRRLCQEFASRLLLGLDSRPNSVAQRWAPREELVRLDNASSGLETVGAAHQTAVGLESPRYKRLKMKTHTSWALFSKQDGMAGAERPPDALAGWPAPWRVAAVLTGGLPVVGALSRTPPYQYRLCSAPAALAVVAGALLVFNAASYLSPAAATIACQRTLFLAAADATALFSGTYALLALCVVGQHTAVTIAELGTLSVARPFDAVTGYVLWSAAEAAVLAALLCLQGQRLEEAAGRPAALLLRWPPRQAAAAAEAGRLVALSDALRPSVSVTSGSSINSGLLASLATVAITYLVVLLQQK
ncbi:hypothetical protein FJT64_016009 [Amphibalanus amphitrite]|uniref:Uncharacterized protein n=1 Tax=Amphibalanus amphitrite TaxID=1232801 RepID=A0A6A4XBT5_AMPAM|nr:hypothetical protein FJT64_016009 [Amphibalanus amphitrite]